MFKIVLDGKHFVETKNMISILYFHGQNFLQSFITSLASEWLYTWCYTETLLHWFFPIFCKNILMDDGNMLYALLLWQILQYSLIIIQLSNFWSINLIWSMNSKTVEHCKRHSWWYSSKFDVWILWPLANSTLNLTVRVTSFFDKINLMKWWR